MARASPITSLAGCANWFNVEPSEKSSEHRTPPVVISTQVWLLSAAMAWTPPSRSLPSGVERVLPLSQPQHRTPPLVNSAQVPSYSAVTDWTSPSTSFVGGAKRSVRVPSPSWPYALEPQHRTPPVVVTAQVCLIPAAIDLTPPITSP